MFLKISRVSIERLGYSFLVVLMAIALAGAIHAPLWSQPSQATSNATETAIAQSGTYQQIPCNTLAQPFQQKEADDSASSFSPFPTNATEGKDYECGYLTVPEVHSQPQGNTIEVGIAIIKRTNPNPSEPLVMFQGGPGGSSINLFPGLFADPDKEEARLLRGERDLIIFEKRGNIYSKPWLACPEVREAEQSDGEDERAVLLKAIKSCRDRLAKEGVNLAAFNSVESAHDVAALVKALGYERVNLYGVSYGTELVFNIMRTHPEIVRSAIVDGVVPSNPSIDAQYAVILDRLIDKVDAACAEDPDCDALYPDIKETFAETFERLNRTPAAIEIASFQAQGFQKQTFTGLDLAESLFSMAYTSGAPFIIPATIYQVRDGNYDIIIQNLYLEGFLSLAGSDSADGTYFSIKCSEDMAYAGELAVEGVSPPAKAWGTETFQTMVDACKIWNVPAVEPSARNPLKSDIPTLLLNGNFDPITPPPFGELVARGLTNSINVVFPANGHGAIGSGTCAIAMMAEFLNDPNKSPDTSCVGEQRVTFITAKNTLIAPGTTWLAKSLLELNLDEVVERIFLLSLLIFFPVVWLLLWLVARLRRKTPRTQPLGAGERYAPWLGVLLSGLSIVWVVLQLMEIGVTAIAGGHGTYGYTRIFVGVDRSLAWIYVIPLLIALLSIAMVVLAILSWKDRYWGMVRRVFFSMAAGVAVSYTLFLAKAGQLTVFF